MAGAAAFGVGASVLFLDLPVIISQLMVDDSFYYLEIARNIAHGNGATFDGIHETNGFQPLFQLLIVPVFWLVTDLKLAIYFLKLLEALLLCGSSVLLLRLVLRLTGGDRLAAWLALTVFFFPEPTKGLPICRGLLIGLESGVNAFMILLLLNLFL